MDEKAYEAQLLADGFVEIETKILSPRPANDAHEHAYAVGGFVLDGTFIVKQGDDPSVAYRPGQAFNVAGGREHTEEIGADGARVVVGRKYA